MTWNYFGENATSVQKVCVWFWNFIGWQIKDKNLSLLGILKDFFHILFDSLSILTSIFETEFEILKGKFLLECQIRRTNFITNIFNLILLNIEFHLSHYEIPQLSSCYCSFFVVKCHAWLHHVPPKLCAAVMADLMKIVALTASIKRNNEKGTDRDDCT